jgi:TonB-dependent receptor
VFRRGFRVFGTQNATPATLQNPVIVNNTIVGGRFLAGSGLGYENVSQDEGDQDELKSYGLNIAYDVTDRLKVSGDVSFSSANSYFYNSGLTLTPVAGLPGDSITYRLNGLNLADISISRNFADRTALQFQNFYIVPQEDNDELTAFQGDARYEVGGAIDSVEVGVRFASREARRTVTSFNGFSIPTPVQLPANLVSLGGFEGDFAKYPGFLVFSIDAVLDQFVGQTRIADQTFSFTREQSFTINEDTSAIYGQVNLDTTMFGVPMRGNLGLRVVNTDQSSRSPISVNGNLQDTQRGKEFTNWLPSANLVFELSPDNLLRVSASRQISRPRFFELRNSAGVGVNNSTGIPSGGGGNPELDPFLANQFDLTYERYFGRSGALVLGAFYKELESFIIGGSIDNFDFPAAGISFPPPQVGAPPTQPTGPFFLPVNGEGGQVYGFEFAYTQSFDFLPAPFDGFGVVINYAYADSDLSFVNGLSGRTIDIGLPGLSKHVSNPTLFYEKAGFSTRLGLRYRSGFVAPQIGLNEQITGIDEELVADAQVSYEFQPGSLAEGVTLLFQANNLTDEPTQSFFGTEAQTGTIQYFGRQFFLGASYTF